MPIVGKMRLLLLPLALRKRLLVHVSPSCGGVTEVTSGAW